VSEPETASPDTEDARSETAKSAAETRYCVEIEHLGSRIVQVRCKTRTEWMRSYNFDPVAALARQK